MLHIISSTNPKGGGPIEGIKQLNAYFKTHPQLGISSEVLCLDAPDEPFIQNCDQVIHAIGPSIGSYRYNAKLKPWLLAHAKEYDAIIINGIWQYHSFGAWRALRQLGKPYYMFTHGMLDPWFNKTYPLKKLKKWLYWPWAEYRVLRDAKAVLFTCQEEKVLAPQSFWLYQAHGVVVNYGTSQPSIDKAHYQALFFAKYPALAGKRIMLYLSRIHEKKGCDLLIKAFAKVSAQQPDLHLVMAGPGAEPLVLKLKALADQLGVADKITWLGMVQGDDKWAAYHASEAFVLPSHQENFGIVVAEALGCGVTVLISNKVNIWREIEADGAGIVADDTVEGTEQLFARWFALDDCEKKEMSEQAITTFKNRFTIHAMTSSLTKVISTEG